MCTGFMNQLGSYAPTGSRARSIPGWCVAISLNQCPYPVSPAKYTVVSPDVKTQPPHSVLHESVRVRRLQWCAGTNPKSTPPSRTDSHQSSSTTRVKSRRRNQDPSIAGTNSGVSRGSCRIVGPSRWS